MQPRSPTAELPTPFTDLAECRRTLSGGSRSFWVASQLLPPSLRNDACGLYAFCREADDLIDEGGDAPRALAILKHRLDLIYAGAPDNNTVDRVLTRIVHRHGLPRPLLEALLEGFAWDASGRGYENLSEVYDYSARVAGVVGVMMAVLMGVRDAHALSRAADLGVAMQLTNIARDVGEDARAGRLYLPRDLMLDAGLTPESFLLEPRFSPALGKIVQRLLTEARALYKRSESGIPKLPVSARPGIYAARLLYAQIGTAIRRNGFNSVDQRAYIGAMGKTQLIFRTSAWMTLGTNALEQPALPECQYLIDAVTASDVKAPEDLQTDSVFARSYRRLLWTLDLFATLDARREAAGSSPRQHG
ncbi:MAG: phytoene/squalene synthase family protein [Cellvibrionales bacterium]|jgi:phytoene synthase